MQGTAEAAVSSSRSIFEAKQALCLGQLSINLLKLSGILGDYVHPVVVPSGHLVDNSAKVVLHLAKLLGEVIAPLTELCE